MYGNDQVVLLVEQYPFLFDDTTPEDVVEIWVECKELIMSKPSLKGLQHLELWSRVLTHYTCELQLVLRLVVLMMVLPLDTSECERVFSLMNDIKCALRERLNNDTVNWLMVWHRASKGKKCSECPAGAILAAFRASAGPRGRYAHLAAE